MHIAIAVRRAAKWRVTLDRPKWVEFIDAPVVRGG
jgi:hypothetical protein